MKPDKQLKGKMKEVYLYICLHTSLFHNFPTYRWLVMNTGASSTSMVTYYIDKLVEYGYLIQTEEEGARIFRARGSRWIPPEWVSIKLKELRIGDSLEDFSVKFETGIKE